MHSTFFSTSPSPASPILRHILASRNPTSDLMYGLLHPFIPPKEARPALTFLEAARYFQGLMGELVAWKKKKLTDQPLYDA